MLLGKYCAKPSLPYLSALAMLGYGLAGAAAPYLAVTLRNAEPRIPFAAASTVLVLTTLGMISAEKRLAGASAKPVNVPPRAFGTFTAPAAMFAISMIALALGYQVHFAIDSSPLFLRFAKPADLEWLMPVFWVGFNLAMFPAGVLTNRIGGYAVMGGAGLIGALAILAAHGAQGLGFLVAAQFLAGAAWGAILMSAFTVAFTIGEHGAEGRMSGLLFSALALATFTRMAMVATGLSGNPELKVILGWVPTLCWTAAGAALLYAAVEGMRRLAAKA